jgi:hypothetical protein
MGAKIQDVQEMEKQEKATVLIADRKRLTNALRFTRCKITLHEGDVSTAHVHTVFL